MKRGWVLFIAIIWVLLGLCAPGLAEQPALGIVEAPLQGREAPEGNDGEDAGQPPAIVPQPTADTNASTFVDTSTAYDSPGMGYRLHVPDGMRVVQDIAEADGIRVVGLGPESGGSSPAMLITRVRPDVVPAVFEAAGLTAEPAACPALQRHTLGESARGAIETIRTDTDTGHTLYELTEANGTALHRMWWQDDGLFYASLITDTAYAQPELDAFDGVTASVEPLPADATALAAATYAPQGASRPYQIPPAMVVVREGHEPGSLFTMTLANTPNETEATLLYIIYEAQHEWVDRTLEPARTPQDSVLAMLLAGMGQTAADFVPARSTGEEVRGQDATGHCYYRLWTEDDTTYAYAMINSAMPCTQYQLDAFDAFVDGG